MSQAKLIVNPTPQDQPIPVITKRVVLDLIMKHRSIGMSTLIDLLKVKQDKRHLDRLKRVTDTLNRKGMICVSTSDKVLDDMKTLRENVFWEPKYFASHAPKGFIQV